MRISVAPAVLLLAGIAPVTASAAPPAGLQVSGQWMRALTGSLPAAGYFTLSNGLDHPVQLVGAASPACGSLTLHQTTLRHSSSMGAMSMQPHDAMPGGSMASMQAVAAVPVPAHGSVGFAPGGYHLMCEQPTGAVRAGRAIPVTLSLGDGSTITVDFPVRGPRG
jgi:copper(I)-binding protein